MAKSLKATFLLLALVLLASVPAVASAKTENSGGALGNTVGQGAAPSVSATASQGAQVRLNSPVSVTVTFSEPVSGFTVDDITVVNGTASGFSGSDGVAVYTFEVTPTSLDEVTVDIPAGVATDGEGNDNTPAPRLSLGIPYDFDGSGGISISGVFAAIDDYFAGKITIAQTLAVIDLYFSSPAEPEPGPSDDCIQTVSSDGTLNGQWASGCDSETRSGSHARYYTFTLDASSEVTIRLESSAANTYLYLRRGDATSGTALHENDDHDGKTTSQITETLASGTYTVEATTYGSGTTGSFNLTIATGSTGAAPPASGDCFQDIGTLTGSVTRTGSWTGACGSTHRAGRYARFYAFTLDTQTAVQIDLTSSEDTYLYLLSGSDSDGTVIAENDDADGQGTNSRITETLASGTYTVEATTYGSGTTGSFNLTIATGSTGTGPPTGNCESTVTSGPTPVQGGLGGVAITGRWVVGCDSVHRSGRNASYISFTQESPGQVIITLESSVDTYLYLLQGEGGSGTVLASNDDYDGGGSNSQITRFLPPGRYTVEATTYSPSVTGEFTLTLSGITVTPVSLGAPENLTATPSGSTAIDLSWDPPSSLGGTPIRGYQIQVRRLGEVWRDVVTNTRSTATSHSHANLTTGNRYYYRVAAIDSLGAGPWSNSADATAGAGLAGPDLIAEVTGPRNGTILEPGDSFTFSVRVRNIGDTQASSTTLRYYRSTDSRISNNDRQLDTDAVSSLASAGTDTESTRVNVPLAGTFYFYGCVDSVSGESDTNNNCSNVIVVTSEDAASGPDLIAEVTGPRNGTILEPGDSFTFSARVRNIGDTQASSTTLRYYHSTDSRISNNDRQLDTDAVSSLASAGTDTESMRVNVPLAGTFYFYVCVDSVSGESDTSNNCSNVIVVTAEDAASGPDLIVSDAYISPRSPLNPGQSFTIFAEVENIGDTRASSSRLNYFITRSRTGAILGSDIIGQDTVSSLSASETGDESLDDSNAPSTPGTYYYGACVNSVSGESNPDNNCSARYTLVVNQPPKPDLTAEVVSVGSDDDQYVGEEFTFSARVRNIGGASTSGSTLRFYRSTNSFISTTDTQLTTRVTGFLSSSGTRTISASSLTAPSDTGTYYYGVCVDSVSGESDTGNNCSAGRRVTVGLPYSLSNLSCTSTGFGNTRAVFSGTLRAFTALDDVKVIGYVKSGLFGFRVKIGEEDLGDLSSGSSRNFEITGGFGSAAINQQCQYEVEWDYP